VPNFVAISQTVAEIWRFFHFKDGGWRHLNFFKFEILTVGRVRRVELRHHDKLRGDRSNCCRDMAIFRFLKMAAATILDFYFFLILAVADAQERQTASPAKFRGDRSNRCRDMAIFPRWRLSTILDL